MEEVATGVGKGAIMRTTCFMAENHERLFVCDMQHHFHSGISILRYTMKSRFHSCLVVILRKIVSSYFLVTCNFGKQC